MVDVLVDVTNVLIIFTLMLVFSGVTIGPFTRDCRGRGQFVASTDRRVGAPLAVVRTGARILRVAKTRDR